MEGGQCSPSLVAERLAGAGAFVEADAAGGAEASAVRAAQVQDQVGVDDEALLCLIGADVGTRDRVHYRDELLLEVNLDGRLHGGEAAAARPLDAGARVNGGEKPAVGPQHVSVPPQVGQSSGVVQEEASLSQIHGELGAD
jgi:hypothetical protein